MGLMDIFGSHNKTSQGQALQSWKDSRNAFFNAILRQDLQKITGIVQKYPGEAFEWKNDKDRSGLLLAMRKNKLESFVHLLDLGASPQEENKMQNPRFKYVVDLISVSVLDLALMAKKQDFVFVLLQRGATRRYSGTINMDNETEDMLKRADKIREEYLALPKDIIESKETPRMTSSEEESLLDKFNQLVKELKDTKTKLAKSEKSQEKINTKLEEALKRIEALESPAPAAILKQAMPGQKPEA